MKTFVRDDHGQSMVEFAFFMPVLGFFLLAALQVGLFFLATLNLSNATRDATRWLAVHPDNTDASFQSLIRGRLPGSLDPNRLTITTSPACASLSGGVCLGRGPGTLLQVTLTYDASSLVVAHFVYLPTTQLSYTMHMRVEQH
jgi:Flp pilus assembly protein TadG